MTNGSGKGVEESTAHAAVSDEQGRATQPVLRLVALPGSSGIQVFGVIDASTRPSWEKGLDMLVERGGGVVDLSGLSFADVRAVNALIEAARRVRPPESLRIQHPPVTVRKVLDLFWPEESTRILGRDRRS